MAARAFMPKANEKVLAVTLPFGLFLRLQWKVTVFYNYGGNRNHSM
jgi:hypothetical protein